MPLSLPRSSAINATLRLPEKLPNPGLLVGWSMEHRHPTRPIGFTYGEPDKMPATGYIDPIQLAGEGHLITIAPTGAGKGRGCIIPALLMHKGPIIVIDPKGENVAITARARRDMGHEVIVLDPMHVTSEPAAALNPLDLVDIESPLAVDEIAGITQTLWGGPVAGRDQFWYSRGRQVLIGLLLHLLADHPREEWNFHALRELVAKTVADPQHALMLLANSRHPEARLIAQTLGVSAPETIGGILAFAQELIDFLRGPLVQEATRTSTFDVDGITRGDPYAIYVVLPPHMLESHGRLLRVWVSALLSGITRRRRKPEQPTLFILDEAAQLGSLPQLRQAITLLRGYGLQTWSFWQDVSQLKMLYPADWQTMVNNCRVLQCFGALNLNAAADMALLTGFGLAEHVIALKPDEMILQLAGDEAVVARLPDYLADPAFKGRFDPNPYYTNRGDIMPRPMPPMRFFKRREVRSEKVQQAGVPPISPETMVAYPRTPAGEDPPVAEDPARAPLDEAPDPLLERLLALWNHCE